MSSSPQKSAKTPKQLTLRSIFWRSWIAGSLGLLIVMGVSAGSTTVDHNDLSTEAVKLEADIKKSIPGSATRSNASRQLVRVKRDLAEKEQALLRDALLAFVPPILILVLAFFISLMLPAREDPATAEESPTAS